MATKPDNVPPVTVAAANPAPIPTPIPTQRDESGTYLQLGAFSNRENAESFLAHVARELAREAVPGSATEGLESKLLIRSPAARCRYATRCHQPLATFTRSL